MADVAGKKGFWGDIEAGFKKMLFGLIVVFALALIGLGVALKVIYDMRAGQAEQPPPGTTLSGYQQVGPNAVTANTLTSSARITSQAATAFGPQMTALMQAQDAKIDSLTTAIGTEAAAVSALQRQPTQFTSPERSASSGALTGYTIEELRPQGPPLASLKLFYDPSQLDPNKAFAGTTWTAYQERFSASIGTWTKQSDGTLLTTVSLNRTVSKPDPTDPTKLLTVGTEHIPLTGGNTFYAPGGDLPSVYEPRWTLDAGFAKSAKSGYSPFGQVDYRVAGHYGVFVGTAHYGVLGGVSFHFGTK